MAPKDLVKEIGYGDTHKKLLSGIPKEEMIVEYGKWAPIYDWQCKKDQATHKAIAAKALIDSMDQPKHQLRVLDAACGTGIVSECLKTYADEKEISLDIVGVDFSPEMLLEAEKKKIYTQLLEADLSDDMKLEENSFDVFMAVGLFIDGHCGPEILPNLMRYVKAGGIGVITVRHKTYTAREEEYLKNFKIANLSVVQNFVADYLAGGVEGNYIVLKKS